MDFENIEKTLSVISQVRADLDLVGHAVADGRNGDAVETLRHCIADLKLVKMALTCPDCMCSSPREGRLAALESKKYRQDDHEDPFFI